MPDSLLTTAQASHNIQSVNLTTGIDQAMPLDQLEARYLLAIAHQFGGDNARLAKQLGISERTLYRKLANARSNPQDNPDATTADKPSSAEH